MVGVPPAQVCAYVPVLVTPDSKNPNGPKERKVLFNCSGVVEPGEVLVSSVWMTTNCRLFTLPTAVNSHILSPCFLSCPCILLRRSWDLLAQVIGASAAIRGRSLVGHDFQISSKYSFVST